MEHSKTSIPQTLPILIPKNYALVSELCDSNAELEFACAIVSSNLFEASAYHRYYNDSTKLCKQAS